MTWLKYIAIILGILIALSITGILITQKVSDGPIEFLQGGPFQSGEVIGEPVTDWSFGIGKSTAFELEGFGTSRVAGYIIHDGTAYMTCDLGFMWRRIDGPQRMILRLIYQFKHWHKDAMVDGRARLRIDGKIYRANFIRVEDPDLIIALKAQLEDLGRQYIAPAELGPPPEDEPNDVWFFRMDPRI